MPRKGDRAPHSQWTDEAIELLGKIPDIEIARMLGIHTNCVGWVRRRRGIPSLTAKAKENVLELADAGKTRREIVAESGRSISAVRVVLRGKVLPKRSRARVWTAEEDAILGTMPDRAAAQKIGVATVTAAVRRKKLGIPAHGEKHNWWAKRKGKRRAK